MNVSIAMRNIPKDIKSLKSKFFFICITSILCKNRGQPPCSTIASSICYFNKFIINAGRTQVRLQELKSIFRTVYANKRVNEGRDMMKKYHAEIIDISLKNRKMIYNYPIIYVKKRFLGLLKIYTISIAENDILQVIKKFQMNLSTALHKEWYISFHTDERAFIVFREKIFSMATKGITPVHYQLMDTSDARDKEAWDEMIIYAKSIGVPDDQCDFLPENYASQNYGG